MFGGFCQKSYFWGTWPLSIEVMDYKSTFPQEDREGLHLFSEIAFWERLASQLIPGNHDIGLPRHSSQSSGYFHLSGPIRLKSFSIGRFYTQYQILCSHYFAIKNMEKEDSKKILRKFIVHQNLFASGKASPLEHSQDSKHQLQCRSFSRKG